MVEANCCVVLECRHMEKGGLGLQAQRAVLARDWEQRTEAFFGAACSCREYFYDILCKDIRGVLISVLKDTVCYSSKKNQNRMEDVMVLRRILLGIAPHMKNCTGHSEAGVGVLDHQVIIWPTLKWSAALDLKGCWIYDLAAPIGQVRTQPSSLWAEDAGGSYWVQWGQALDI